MFEQAAGLAALAAISPPALLIAAIYLGSASPRKMTTLFLVGAVLMTVAMGIVILVALRAGGLSLPGHRSPRYGLRLGLGVLAIAAAAVMIWRRRSRPQPAQAKPETEGRIARLAARPRPLTALAAGVLVFGPSVGFIAAVQAIATAKAGLLSTAGALALVVVIAVAFVWVPLAVHFIAPDRTTSALRAINSWLSTRGRALLPAALAILGVILLVDGAVGIA